MRDTLFVAVLLLLCCFPAGMSKLAPGEESSMEQVVTSAVPLGRMGDKADIALACVYLASSAGR
jgi:NAD(P)-dependent dehydrogenase (short-subunit alcohol dehydrogenase family)